MEKKASVRIICCKGINCERNGASQVISVLTKLADHSQIPVGEAICLHRCRDGPNFDLEIYKKIRQQFSAVVLDPIDGNPTPQDVVDAALALSQSSRQKAKFWPIFSK